MLPCGHALLMAGLDDLLELEFRERSAPEGEGGGTEERGCYLRGPDGTWRAPAKLQVGPGPRGVEEHACRRPPAQPLQT